MIKPNMATMLGYLATDAGIAQLPQALVREAADESFNCITVDGDTSTNDSSSSSLLDSPARLSPDASAAGEAQLREAVIVARELAQAHRPRRRGRKPSSSPSPFRAAMIATNAA